MSEHCMTLLPSSPLSRWPIESLFRTKRVRKPIHPLLWIPFFILLFAARTEGQQTRYMGVYGNSMYNEGVATLTPDNNTLIVVGNSSGFLGNSAPWLGWTDTNGILVRDMMVSRSWLLRVTDAILANNIIHLTGYALRDGNYRNMLLRITLAGEVITEHYWGGAGWSFSHSLLVTAPDTIYVAGATTDTLFGTSHGIVYCLDSTGIPRWEKRFGDSLDDAFMVITIGHDESLLMGGYSKSHSTFGDSAIWVVCTDKQGNLLWETIDDHPGPDVVFDIKAKKNTGYVVCGQTSRWPAFGNDAYMMHLDNQGAILFVNSFGKGKVAAFHSILMKDDDSYRAAGYYDGQYSFGERDFFIQNADIYGWWSPALGSIILGGVKDDIAVHLTETPDGGYIATGTTHSFGPGTTHILVMKTDSLIVTGQTMPHQISVGEPPGRKPHSRLTIWPVPATEQIHVNLSGKEPPDETITTATILDMTGKTVAVIPVLLLPGNTITIALQPLSPGLYFLKAGNHTARFIVR
jgi:hypothetical protein